jgi:DNA repair exonuclease SbcCD nuclease subunit
MPVKNNPIKAIITDQHFGARSDSPIFLDYFQRFYDNVFFPYLDENKITEVIDLGDTFDRRKFVNFLSFQRSREMYFDRLLERKIKVHSLLGNHTTYYKNTSKVNAVKELCGMYPNITIYDTATEVTFDKTKVLLVPWINEENYDHSMKMIKTTTAKILMGHLEIKGFLVNRGLRLAEGLAVKIFKRFKAVWSGHLHHKSEEGNISYLGSPYEIKFDDMNDPRGFHTWKSSTTKLNFIENPHRMFYKLYYDDKDKTLDFLLKKVSDKFRGAYVKVVVQNRTNPLHFDKFIETLFSMNPADVKIDDAISLSEGDEEMKVDLAEDTLTILNKYVDNLEIDSDKEKIKDEIKILYTEASGMGR